MIKNKIYSYFLVSIILLLSVSCGGNSNDKPSHSHSNSSSEITSNPIISSSSTHSHNESGWIIDKDPTCEEEGLQIIKCLDCGEVLDSETIAIIDHNYVDGSCSMCGEAMPDPVPSLYEENGIVFINFGRYPKTHINDPELINALQNINDVNEYGYIEYDGEEYKARKSKPCNSGLFFDDGSEVIRDEINYFKVEPIKWRVIYSENNTYELLCEDLIDTYEYFEATEIRTFKGKTIFPNNYQYSEIRSWLNGYDGSSYYVSDYTNDGFYNLAFKEYEKNFINLKDIDNSDNPTNITDNIYASDNTQDKVYLLSYNEVSSEKYGFSSENIDVPLRQSRITDYALNNGSYTLSNDEKFGMWILRTASTQSDSFYVMYSKNVVANANGKVFDKINSVRPALSITIDASAIQCNKHQEGEWIEIKEASCIEPGIKQLKCNKCQKILKEEQTIVEHNYVDDKCVFCEKTAPKGMLVRYEENGKRYINIGRYPQSYVYDKVIQRKLDNISTTNERGYLELDNEEYARVTGAPIGLYYLFNSKRLIRTGETYYFKVEPIKWRINHMYGNNKVLISEMILDCGQYSTFSQGNRVINDVRVYPNNYEYSNIRAWLNGYDGTSYNVENYTNKGFYDIAFNAEEKEIINTTLYKNDLESTGDSYNYYVSNDTNDKISLLGTNEMKYYPFMNGTFGDAAAMTTDYSRSKGLRIDECTVYGNGIWMLRTPRKENPFEVKYIYFDGNNAYTNTSYNDVTYRSGIRPVMEITFID